MSVRKESFCYIESQAFLLVQGVFILVRSSVLFYGFCKITQMNEEFSSRFL